MTADVADLSGPSERRKPDWSQLAHLVEAARKRDGWSDAQIDYLRACVGIAWAKGHFAAEVKAAEARAVELDRRSRRKLPK